MKELKIGVIGAGGRGVIAREAHHPEQGVRIVAGADPSRKALDALREFVGGDLLATTDYRELLADRAIDAVFVAAPDFLHEEMAVAALEAGKAVYLEKPMTITLEGCDRILETARRTGSKLFVGHNMRHFPVVLKMKEVIDSGLIGEIQAGTPTFAIGGATTKAYDGTPLAATLEGTDFAAKTTASLGLLEYDQGSTKLSGAPVEVGTYGARVEVEHEGATYVLTRALTITPAQDDPPPVDPPAGDPAGAIAASGDATGADDYSAIQAAIDAAARPTRPSRSGAARSSSTSN